MLKRWMWSGFILAGFSAICASGCSVGYVTRAAFEQSKILLSRRPLEEVLLDPESTDEEREKLRLVSRARAYAIEIGLDPGCSFTKYTKVDKDTLAWVLVGARRDSFLLHTWWFPIVGRVPYKGFFDRADADAAASSLADNGYECSVRGTEAFSTLGWFSDPVLSTTLRHAPPRIANTIIHESVHSTVWIKNNVAFNESLANFIGTEASVGFFAREAEQCSPDQCVAAKSALAEAERDRAFQYELSLMIDALYVALDSLYRDESISSEDKNTKRVAIFEEHLQPFRKRFPTLQILKAINNAEIIQFKLYLSSLVLFREHFDRVEGDWNQFMKVIRGIAEAMDADSKQDPFIYLRELSAPGARGVQSRSK